MTSFTKSFTLALAFALSGGALSASAAVATQFTFETNTPADLNNSQTISGITADSGTGTASAFHGSAATDYSTPGGNGSANSLSSNTWAVGDYYQFTADLTSVTGAQLEFDQVSSSTGPGAFKVQISTDGTNFTDLAGSAYTSSSAVSFSASGSELTTSPPRFLFDISALDGFSTAAIRLVDTAAPTGTSGTSRVDNVTFGSNLTPPTVAPEPASLGVLALGGLLLLRRRK
jgi:MYXO-CTERM domain-containing protein